MPDFVYMLMFVAAVLAPYEIYALFKPVNIEVIQGKDPYDKIYVESCNSLFDNSWSMYRKPEEMIRTKKFQELIEKYKEIEDAGN